MSPKLINLNLKAVDKGAALMKICDMIAENHKIGEPKALFDNIMNRESLHSTAVGHGIAIPHARCDLSESILIAVGLFDKGVEFSAADGTPVNLIFVIVSPKNETASYLQLLSQLASLLNVEKVRNELISAKTSQEFLEIVKKNERR